jgi:hypothetical protein
MEVWFKHINIITYETWYKGSSDGAKTLPLFWQLKSIPFADFFLCFFTSPKGL